MARQTDGIAKRDFLLDETEKRELHREGRGGGYLVTLQPIGPRGRRFKRWRTLAHTTASAALAEAEKLREGPWAQAVRWENELVQIDWRGNRV